MVQATNAKTPPEAFNSFDNFSDKIDEEGMELFLLGYLNRDFSGIVSWNSSTVDYNISVFLIFMDCVS